MMRYKVVSEIFTMCGSHDIVTLMGDMSLKDAKSLCKFMSEKNKDVLYTVQVDND